MKKSRLCGAVCAYFVLSLVAMPSQAELIERADGLIYDTVLNITWAQPDPVERDWQTANNVAAGLVLGGIDGWRLPYVSVAAGPGQFEGDPVDCANATEEECRDNEMGYMFFHNLGGTDDEPILDSGHLNLALFPSLENDDYWSGQGFNSFMAWRFRFINGFTGALNDGNDLDSWVVHDGDVGTVPNDGESWGAIKAMYK